jgi:hypothetical protein
MPWVKYVNIAKRFNTKPYTISKIKRGVRWSHITNFGTKGVDYYSLGI